jgi:hypothetical protein
MKNHGNLILLVLLLFLSNAAIGQLAPAALSFDGVNDVVSVPANTNYNVGTGDFTIEMWFMCLPSAGSPVYLFSNWGSSNGIEISLYTGRLSFRIGNQSTVIFGFAPDFRDSVCHHLAFRRTGGIASYIIDGTLCPIGNMNYNLSASGPLNIGSNLVNSFKGTIKEVRFWNRALTQTEVINGFNSTAASLNMIGYWRMNATSGQTVTDYSSIANHGVRGYNANIETSDPGFANSCPPCTPPPATIANPATTTLCNGSSIQLNANTGAGLTYQWFKDGILIAGATSSAYSVNTHGLYFVKVTNAGGCFDFSQVVSISDPAVQYQNLNADVPITNGTACLNDGSVQLSAAGGNSFLWYKNGISTGSTSSTLNVFQSQAGTYTCRIISNGCTLTTNPVTLKYYTIDITTAYTNFCTGSTDLFAVENFTYNDSSSWYNSGVLVGSGYYGQYPASQSGSYWCVVNNPAYCPVPITSSSILIQSGSPPDLNWNPEPQLNLGGYPTIDTCVNNSNFVFNLEVNNFDWMTTNPQFTWTDGNNNLPIFGSTAAITESGILQCYGSNMCGTGTAGPIQLRILNAANPPVIKGNSTGCPNVQLYFSANWDSYQWKLNGVNIPGATSGIYAATQSGTYTCMLSNTCGSLLSAPKTITMSGPGAQLTASQPHNLCSGPKTLFANPPGYTYKWLRNNVLVNGATTQQYVASIGGQYRVIVTNACKSDTSNILNLPVETTVPVSPGTLSGPARVCPGATGIVYSIAPVSTAFTYQWLVPAGITITSAPSNTTSITVNVSGSFSLGDIQVRAGNACGWGPYRTKTIRKNIPATPGAITGSNYGVCNSTKTYSIAAVNLATTYQWVAPAGASITGGQGTTSVSVSFSNSYGIDTLKVRAGNSCNYSAYRTLVVRGKPATPGIISGPSTACNGQTGVNFSIIPVSGATSYTWTRPTGTIITSGQGTNSATMTFGPNSGDVKVKALNSCGTSGNSIKPVTVNCREGDLLSEDFEVYPNPSDNTFQLSGDFSRGEAEMELYDANSRLLLRCAVNNGFSFGDDLAAGIYFVSVRYENRNQMIKLVKH